MNSIRSLTTEEISAVAAGLTNPPPPDPDSDPDPVPDGGSS